MESTQDSSSSLLRENSRHEKLGEEVGEEEEEDLEALRCERESIWSVLRSIVNTE